MDQAAAGKKALSEGDYVKAIDSYTAALQASPTSPDYLINRSTALHRAKRYPEALTDANNAVLNAQKRAKRELIVEAQFRRGCALYGLERYGDAEFVFGVVKRMHNDHKMVATWMQRTTMSISKLDAADERRKCTVQETPEAQETTHSTATTNGASHAPPVEQAPTAPPPPQQTPADKIRYEWYQNSENLYFTLFAKGIPKDKLQTQIDDRSLSISFPLTSGFSYDLTLDPLFGSVIVDKCIVRPMSTKLEVILAKATAGMWKALEGDDSKPTATASTDLRAKQVSPVSTSTAKSTGPAYPTSSKSGPKDWDKVVDEARKGDDDGKDKNDDDDDESGDPANAFFKKLYKDASPDVQRAMMKSYTESNGTSLSTNWEEVSKGKVETLPPDGMEAKKW